MRITIIAAIASNNAIGKDNDLLWHLPEDMKFFKKTTTDHFVIMGRKNYFSIPEKYRPLPNRTNIVISRRTDLKIDGAELFPSVEKAIEFAIAAEQEEIFVIGGGQIYSYFLEKNLVNRMLITHVFAEFDADVFFPDFDKNQWESRIIIDHPQDDKNPLEFTIIEYLKHGGSSDEEKPL